MGQFSFQYPLWFLGLCLLLAIASGLLMYYKSRLLSDRTFAQKLLLSALRITAVFLILLLLLNPFYKFYKQNVKKPVILFAQDISSSFKFKDSSKLKNYIDQRDKAEEQLSDKYDLIHLEFANKTLRTKTDQFNGTSTNLSSVFDYASDQLDLENLKGIILATDGIYNSGKNPLYHSTLKQIPVYSILFGDTLPERDLSVTSLFFNDIIYAGDKFAVQADFQSWNLQDQSFNVQLKKFDNGSWSSLQSDAIKISQKKFFLTKEFIIQTELPGIYRYKVECSTSPLESNIKNNQREFYVEVLDSKKKVLILSYSVHPDLSAIRESLLSNKNYEVDIKSISEPVSNLDKYSLLILHQLPAAGGLGNQVIQQATSLKIPMLFILGSQTDITAFNKSQDVIQISGTSKTANEALPVYRSGFSQFVVNENTLDAIQKFPPLNAVYGNYSIDPSASILFFQKIGKIETNYPLWLCSDKNGYRVSVILGDGIWKWKLNDFMNSNSFQSFFELINKTVQFTSTKEDKRKFRVTQPKRIFDEGESIGFYAEFYNDNLERINAPDANLTIVAPGNVKYDYSFSKPENYYSLDIGSLAPNDYSYQAVLNWNRKEYTVNGKFSIQSLDIENSYRVADFDLLRNLSQHSGGKTYLPTQFEQLINELNENQTARPIISQSLEIHPLIDQKWVFFIIFICLALEWFLRRFWGSY